MPQLLRQIRNLRELYISATDRGVLVGTTGCGKSTAAKFLLAPYQNVAVFDPKGLIRWRGYKRFTEIEDLVANAHKYSKFIYAPNHFELQDDGVSFDRFFQYVYTIRNTFCYVDEVYACCQRQEIPHYLHALITRGRERGSGVLCATQRPMSIPQVILSESESWFIFSLAMPGDRKKIEETVGVSSDEIAKLRKRQFIFVSLQNDYRTKPLTLRLPSPTIDLTVKETRQSTEERN